jgi:hypothetical protein
MYQSAYLLQTLAAQGFTTDTLSVDRDKSPCLALRSGFEAGRIRLCRQMEFMREAAQLLELERTIDHTSEGSKDTTDAVAGAYANAIRSEETKALSTGNQQPVVKGIRLPRGNATPDDPFGFFTRLPLRQTRLFDAWPSRPGVSKLALLAKQDHNGGARRAAWFLKMV